MIVTATSPEDYQIFLDFARSQGVKVPPTLHPTFRVLGRLDSKAQLVAVMEFSGFSKRTCQIHITGTLTADLIRAMFSYAFECSNLVQIFGHISASNWKLQDLAKFVGFKELHRVKYGWDEVTDMIVMGIYRSECRWVKER